MSTFYLSPSCMGMPLGGSLPPSSQTFPFPLAHHHHHHHHHQGAVKSGMESLKSGGCAHLDARAEDGKLTATNTFTTTAATTNSTISSSSNTITKGRCRSPIVPPLRHRQLPASFWQEPNVPRGHLAYPHFPYPFPFSHWVVPPCSSSSSSCLSTSPTSEDRGGVAQSGPGKQNGVQVHKEFLDRLQSAQVRGYDLAASRFPITEFLFYNYGLRSYLDSSSAGAEMPPPPLLPSMSPPHAHPHSCSSGFRPEDAAAAAANSRKTGTLKTAGSRGSGPPPRISDSVCGSVGLTLPTVCPYLGYNCPHLHSGRPHRLWDCVLGQAAAASSSSLSLPEESRGGHSGGGSMWKGLGGGRTASAYPARYHPFAHV